MPFYRFHTRGRATRYVSILFCMIEYVLMKYVIPLHNIKKSDKRIVGGKAYSLGFMMQRDINVPPGFAITTRAYLLSKKTKEKEEFEKFKIELYKAFDMLNCDKVCVRSSAIAEDSSSDSWAGQLESYLNIERGHLLSGVEKCWDSINSARIKTYVKDKNVKEEDMAVGVVVQAMVDSQSSGVMFTTDPTGDTESILIEAGLGLGEAIVQAIIIPDRYLVTHNLEITDRQISTQKVKISVSNGVAKEQPVSLRVGSKQKITDEDIIDLAKQALELEKIYGHPTDIEWAKSKKGLFIVQARPITIIEERKNKARISQRLEIELGSPIINGVGASGGTVSGKARVIKDLSELSRVEYGDILVTKTTTPDFVAVFDKIVGAITDTGGLVSHTALVSRELGIPAIVGTEIATKNIKDGAIVTIDGYNGSVYSGRSSQYGKLRYQKQEDEYFPPPAITGDDIEDFLSTLTYSYNEVSEMWPMSPVQLYGYLDVNLGLDMLHKLKKLVIEEKKTFEDIAQMFDRVSQIRLFLSGVTVSGLKVARRLNIAPVTIQDQINLTLWLIYILKAKSPRDPLALAGGNFVWDDKYSEYFLDTSEFLHDPEYIQATVELNVALFNYVWAYYWDYFPECGHEDHGTYTVNSSKYPDAKGMVIRDYFDLIPSEVWGDVSSFSKYKSISIATLYDTDKIYFKFTGRILNKHSLVPRIRHAVVLVDGKTIHSPEDVRLISAELNKLSSSQIKLVNKMDKLDLVKRGDKMANYARKTFHSYFGNWYNPQPVESIINKLGRKFVDEFSSEKNRSVQTMRDFYDPRSDFIPSLDH